MSDFTFVTESGLIDLDGVVAGVGDMPEGPGAGDAHALEPEALHVVDDGLGGLGVLPSCLGFEPSLVVPQGGARPAGGGLERVAQVPSGGHVVDDVGGRAVELVEAGQHQVLVIVDECFPTYF